MSFLSHGFGRLRDLADIPSPVGNEFKFLGLDGAGNPFWGTPAGGGGGGFVTSVTDTAEINLTVTSGALSADIELDSIDETKLSPGVQDALADGQAAFARIPSGSFYMQTGADLTIPLIVSAPYAFTIEGLEELQTSAGTITAAIQINGTNVTGLSSLSVTTTPSNPTASGSNTVSIGDRVTLVLSANSSAADLEFQLIGAW